MRASTYHPRLRHLRYLNCEEVEVHTTFDPGLGERSFYLRSPGGEHVLELNLWDLSIMEQKQIPQAVTTAVQEWASTALVMPTMYIDDTLIEFDSYWQGKNFFIRAERDGANCRIKAHCDDRLAGTASIDLLPGSTATDVDDEGLFRISTPDLFQVCAAAQWAWGQWV